MGILELILILILIAAIFGRGYLALGIVVDIFIALLVIAILYRVFLVLF